jgi:hypothetical protein
MTLPITRDEGVPLAVDEATRAMLWPRELYPSAEEAIEAHVRLDPVWAGFGPENLRVRLAWAYRVPGRCLWYWTYVEGLLPEYDPLWPERELEWPPVECWEVDVLPRWERA